MAAAYLLAGAFGDVYQRCRKIGYESRAMARAALAAHQRARVRRNGSGGMQIYKCRHCPGVWHIGHPIGTRNKESWG